MAYELKSAEGQCAATSTVVYTCPTNKTAVVNGSVTNRSSSDMEIEALVEDRLILPYKLTLDPGDSMPICGRTMTAGDELKLKATAANLVDYKLDILERSTS